MNAEILVGWPSGPAVVRDYLEGVDEAVAFYGAHFRDAGAYRRKAAEVETRFGREERERAAAAITVPAGGDPGRLDRFVEEGGYVVTTGQQPALFGGPLYSVYKALTAARLAARLEEALGAPVLPLFWVASEDHDWAEADHTSLVGVDNALHTVRVPDPDPGVRPALHRVPLGEGADEARAAFVEALPDTEFTSGLLALVERAARPEATLPEGFHVILQELLGPAGVCFTDAADPALKRGSVDILLQEVDRAAELEGVLEATARGLRDAGYDLQVTLMDGGLNLFVDTETGRHRVHRRGGGDGFVLRGTDETLRGEELRALVADRPASVSPNVLLRPVVESDVFPTVAYVAGPGEMAYFAQLRAYFEAFGIAMPVIHPRASVTVVEPKIRKVLDKFDLDVGDLGIPFHELASRVARDQVPEDLQKAAGSLRGAIGKGVGELEREVKAVDPTLKGPVQAVRSQAFAALDEVERKVATALKRENEIALAQLEKARLHLHPDGAPQERVMNPFYYLSRFGREFVEAVGARIEAGPDPG